MAYNIIAEKGIITTNYETANPCNLMTLDNIVMLCDDLIIDDPNGYTANDVLLTLSDSKMFPDTEIIMPVCVTEPTGTRIAPLTINIAGEFSLPFSYVVNTLIHLNGICWHANSKYYTPAIGNIYNNGTSPLSEL